MTGESGEDGGLKRTQLYQRHVGRAKMTEFAGYEMPLWYTSISDEHMAVRAGCGVFDVSHMGRLAVRGPEATPFLERLVPTKVAAQLVGRSFYTLLLNESGKILDDLIIMKLGEDDYMAVVNAANLASDLAHITHHAQGSDVSVADTTQSSALVAVQGPRAKEVLQPVTDGSLDDLKRFRCREARVAGRPSLISRTGYTGEDGYEVLVRDATQSDPSAALSVWDAVAEHAKPCGLGARDSLRLEAGYPLYGLDIDSETDPFEADLAWVLTPEKTGFVGSEALAAARSSTPKTIRTGVVLDEKIPRAGFEVLDPSGAKVGRVTSGTFSPVLKKGIAICYLDSAHSSPGSEVKVMVRGTGVTAKVKHPPFYDERLFGAKRQSNDK